jgi:hypothetical protein
MGMYDTVVIEGLKLPNLPKEINSFLKLHDASVPNDYQTKDLDNFLATFHVNKTGQIFKDVAKSTGKKIPYVNPFSAWKCNEPLLIRLYRKTNEERKFGKLPAYVQETKTTRQKSNITQAFEIYTYEEIGGRYVSISYNIEAIQGKVKKVKLGRCELESEKSAQERHARNAEWQKEHMVTTQDRLALQAKWYYPVLREIYNPAVFFTRLTVQKVCSKIVQLSYHWHGV